MTIKLLTPRDLNVGGRYVTHPVGSLVTLSAATEAGLIASKEATSDLTGGVVYVPPVPSGQPVGVEAIPSSTGIDTVSFGGKTIGTAPRMIGKRPAVTRCVASNFASPVAADSKCYAHAIALPIKFDAVRIGFVHVGGAGAVVGMTAAVAATDDLGDRSNANTAAGRRFATPYRSGVEKNEYSADGWSRVTVAGATSWGIADAGGNNINIAWSDLIEVHAIEDSAKPGAYPLLVRVYGGTGVFTRTGNVGLADPAKWYAEAGNDYVLGCSRVAAGDAVGTLANWANLNNVGFNDSDCIAMVIEAYGIGGVKTLMMVGDSRFGTAPPSLDATNSYRTLMFRVEQALRAAGKKVTVARCARGAQPTAVYSQWADSYLSQLCPDASLYLCYSINDGVPTQALLNTAKMRVLKHIESCAKVGTIPALMSIFPYGTGFGAALPAVLEFDAWVMGLGYPAVSPLRKYGDLTTGAWLPGLAEDSNHPNDATNIAEAAWIVSALDSIL